VAKHESFLVRVWWRARSGEGQWVGRLEHLQERAVQNFHDPEELLAHLRTVLMPLEGAEQGMGDLVFEPLEDVKETGTGDPASRLVSLKASSKGEEVHIPSQSEMARTTQ
jgi:hypothetical protein